MQLFEEASNSQLLSTLAGKPVGDSLMQKYGQLTSLAQASFDELCQVDGVGQSKAAAIKSAFLLAQRLSRESYPQGTLLDTPERIADMLREQNRAYPVETFQVVLLNTRRRLIGVEFISQGTLDTLLVHPREVFLPAILKRASALVVAHNHPSGDPTPSEADIRVTRDLIRAGQVLRIKVLDHVVLGHRTVDRPKDFTSLREAGYFYT
jgi:DNA repair protein RadC